MAGEKDFSEKLKKLVRGKRSFPNRLLLAAAPSFALAFTLFFFGPLDLTYISRDYLTYTAFTVLPSAAWITGIVFLVFLLAASIPGGKVHAFLVSAYTGIAAAIYLQGAFLNPDFGSLDGHTVNWTGYSKIMMINLAVWFLIVLIPYLVRYFSSSLWQQFVRFLSIVLILMQAVSLTGKLIDQTKMEQNRSGTLYLSKDNLFTVGAEKNIAVFLLDTVSNSDIEAMTRKYPEALAPFRDFTRYDNANSRYMFTVPSLISLLTGEEWDCEHTSIRDYMNNAWRSEKAENFYRTLDAKGYDRNFYGLLSEIVSDPAAVGHVFTNLRSSVHTVSINYRVLFKLYKLSFYRYFPIALKPFFVIYTNDIRNIALTDDALTNEWDFVEEMTDSSLVTGNANNSFSFYYLAGTHRPYRMDERGRLITSDAAPEFATDYSGMEDQLAGFFYLISDYMRQLKELKLYDETGIIILADHGNNADPAADHQPVYFIKMPGERHDEMTVRSAPITIQECFLPDVLAMIGESGTAAGMTSAAVDDEMTERWSRTYGWDEAYPLLTGTSYNVLQEYRYEGDGGLLTEQWINGSYTSIPMIDSYY